MYWLVFTLILLTLNGLFGVKDVKRGNTTKSAAFTWFVIGWLTLDTIKQIIELLS
jgi:hypothetical protein